MSPIPFADASRRTAWLRATLLSATFLGLIASAPVWLNARSFPLVPIFSGFPILPVPLDRCLFGVMLASLVGALWFYRPAVALFLAASLLAYCQDANRGQPWFYLYWVMLLFSLFPEPSATAACRCALAVVYVWGGIQKMNARFFEVTPGWFVAPAEHWPLPEAVMSFLRLAVAATPYIELAIGLCLWVPRLRRVAFAGVLLVHLAAVLFLGPLGHNYNWVVWPWNLAMIALAFTLFADGELFGSPRVATALPAPPKAQRRSKPVRAPLTAPTALARPGQTFRELRRSRPALVLVALFAFLPVLSYWGRWDSYFSFALYSENLAVANFFVTEAFRDNLPPPMRGYVQTFPEPYDPQRQGPYSFAYAAWAYEEMRVPPISEPRNFLAVYRALRPYADGPDDLRLIIGPRFGPVIFQAGDRTEFLERSQ